MEEETIIKLKCLMLFWGGTIAAFYTYGIECNMNILKNRLQQAIRYYWMMNSGCDNDITCEASSFVSQFDCECSNCDSTSDCDSFTIQELLDDPLIFFTTTAT